MTVSRLLVRAWIASIAAAGFGFLYLHYAPVPGSHAADTALTIGLSAVGAVFGIRLAPVLEALASRRKQADVIRIAKEAADTRRYEQLTARGA